jgi:hypothetical protein
MLSSLCILLKLDSAAAVGGMLRLEAGVELYLSSIQPSTLMAFELLARFPWG